MIVTLNRRPVTADEAAAGWSAAWDASPRIVARMLSRDGDDPTSDPALTQLMAALGVTYVLGA